MSLFICAHGELYSKCKWCYEFEEKEKREEEDENENNNFLSTIIRTMKKEKIEY